MRAILLVAIFVCSKIAIAQGVQCDTFTGSLTASIPMITITSGDVSVPVGISYRTNGVKVNSATGTAGVGWNLYAGGAVSRELRGLPDDHTLNGVYGWLYGSIASTVNSYTPTAPVSTGDCTTEYADYSALSAFQYTQDTEPDIFLFNAPGLSGSFVFDHTKTIRTIPYQDVDISYTREVADGLISQIVITTNTGVKYTFDKGQTIFRKSENPDSNTLSLFTTRHNQYSGGITYNASWDLTKIESPSGGSIRLDYEPADASESVFRYREVNESASPPVVDTLYVVRDSINSQHLSSITGANIDATLKWSGNLIGSVEFIEKTYNATERFNFKYIFPKTTWTTLPHTIQLPFLVEMSQEFGCKQFPSYKFEYYGVDEVANTTSIPFNSDRKQDLFGYYNINGTSQVPDLWIKSGDTGTDGERFRYYSGYPGAGTSYTQTLNGGNRGVEPTTVYYGALEKLTLPTGGYTHVTYEPADYYDATSQDTEFGPGARVKTIATLSDVLDAQPSLRYYSYLTTTSKSSGVMPYRPMFVVADKDGVVRIPDNLAPDESINYTRVEVSTTGEGRTVYEFNAPGVYPQTSSGDFSAPLSRIVRDGAYCSSGFGYQKLGQYYSYPFAPTVNYAFERGLPSVITYYTRDNKIAASKIYTYQRSTLTISQIPGIRFEKANNRCTYSKYSMLSNVNKYILTESNRLYDQTDGTNTKFVETTTTYTYNSSQLISAIGTTDSDNTTVTQTLKYAKDYPSNGTDTQSQMIHSLVANKRGGTLVETTRKRGSSVTDAALTIFGNSFGATRILPKAYLVLGDPTGFSESTITGNNFVAATNYDTARFISSYDEIGNPTNIRDRSRSISSFVYGYNKTLTAIEISNARNDQVVFADFEPNTAMAPTFPNTKTTADVFAGKYSLNLAGAASLTKSSVARGQGKYYRFTSWVKASSAASLTISIDGSPAGTVSYTNVNTWQFVEARIDMSSITTAFSFSVTPSANVTIDNLVFLPEAAIYVTHSYDPLSGKTSDIDSRGNGSFLEYDDMGRPTKIANQKKELLKVTEYHYKVDPSPPPIQIFGPTTPKMLTSATYTVDIGCSGSVTYVWTVDGVAVGTSASLSFSFDRNKDYQVRITVTSANGSAYSEMTVHPQPVLRASLSGGGLSGFHCTETGGRVLTVNLSGCYSSVRYSWYANSTWADGHDSSYTVSLGTGDVDVRCDIEAWCVDENTGYSRKYLITLTKHYTYLGGPC